jgi:hypothetical protein
VSGVVSSWQARRGVRVMPRVSAVHHAPSTVIFGVDTVVPLHLSSVIYCGRFPLRLCAFLGHSRGGVRHVFWGGRKGGLGENLEPGDLGCSGGSGFSPSAFPDWSPLLPVYSRSRAVVFPTSPSCSLGG